MLDRNKHQRFSEARLIKARKLSRPVRRRIKDSISEEPLQASRQKIYCFVRHPGGIVHVDANVRIHEWREQFLTVFAF
jgi:hypothetical protein